jgi:hypothetical protein
VVRSGSVEAFISTGREGTGTTRPVRQLWLTRNPPGFRWACAISASLDRQWSCPGSVAEAGCSRSGKAERPASEARPRNYIDFRARFDNVRTTRWAPAEFMGRTWASQDDERRVPHPSRTPCTGENRRPGSKWLAFSTYHQVPAPAQRAIRRDPGHSSGNPGVSFRDAGNWGAPGAS